MIDVNTTFYEAAAQRSVESVPLGHLSVELGHLYAEDFGADDGYLDRYFARIAPWLRTVRADCAAELPPGVRPRISTCFLIDDYFNKFGEPGKVIGALLETAARHDMAIDYIARESACSVAEGLHLAQLVLDRIVSDPAVNTNGSRPPAAKSGWLSNGERTSESTVPAAMKGRPPWSPPVENGPNLHSIYMDVQLFSEPGGVRTWSCAFLASVWQLLRLGMLRHTREAPIRPRVIDADTPMPAEWSELPPVMRCNPAAAPFSAYRTMSILQRDFISVESAVSMILSQVSVDGAVLEQVAARSKNEGIDLPGEVTARIGYALLGR